MCPNKSSVIEYYSGKSVLITGATGFIGKVLVEKILFSCPDIEKIYVLLRTNGVQSPAERLEKLLQSRVFKFRFNSLAIDKIIAIKGDICKPELGLSQQDRQLMIENVSVLFHIAATVKFTGPLNEFVEQNVLSADYALCLAKEMHKLESIVYVSTAYSNCHLNLIEEKIYPLEKGVQFWIDKIIAEKSNITPKEGDLELLGRPNAYVLSKTIAENLIREKYSNLPVVICRPSIVTCAYKEPAKGWCDSLNGLTGLFLLGCLGILRTMKFIPRFKADIIPVDFVANSLIVIGWHAAVFPQPTQVVNLVSGTENPVTWDQLQKYTTFFAVQLPSIKLVRPVELVLGVEGNMGKVKHFFVNLFSHQVFAYVFDAIALLSGNKRFMVKIVQNLNSACKVLSYFATREWYFKYDNYKRILELLSDDEQFLFFSNIRQIDWSDYCRGLVLGNRRYLLSEADSTIEEAIQKQKSVNLFYPIVIKLIQLAAIGMVLFVGKKFIYM